MSKKELKVVRFKYDKPTSRLHIIFEVDEKEYGVNMHVKNPDKMEKYKKWLEEAALDFLYNIKD